MCDCDGITIPKGDTGEQGPIGLTGAKGDTGATGATGAQGAAGNDGNDGADAPAITDTDIENFFDSNPTFLSTYITANAASITGLIPSGVIMDYTALTAPTGWLLADGSAVSRTTYAALFAIIGITFGNGDGSTTFNLPDTRRRIRVGRNYDVATAGYSTTSPGVNEENYNTIGNTGGSRSVILAKNQIPKHQHTMGEGDDGANSVISVLNTTPYQPLTAEAAGTDIGGSGAFTVEAVTISSTATLDSGNTGNGNTDGLNSNAHENRQPYIVLTQIIKI